MRLPAERQMEDQYVTLLEMYQVQYYKSIHSNKQIL